MSIKDLPVGAVFFHRDGPWRVTRVGDPVVAFSEHRERSRRFYDPVTASKAGEFCWDESVEVLSGA